jgi:hypothetical protein
MEKLRHYCRNPRCRSKLKQPVENPRAAFCTHGCHSSFYLKRCLVCERPLVKKSTQQKVCFRNTCRRAFRQQKSYFGYRGSPSTTQPQEVPILRASKWVVIAGPPLTPDQLRGCHYS